jgi:hypothetical protein
LAAAVLGVVLAGAASASAQSDAPSGTTPQTAEQAYKNIQVLKGVPADEVLPAMEFMRASLGVECDYCHMQGAFEQDGKKPKQTARKMMQMMFTINKDNFNGQRQVTCYSCHQGAPKPVSTPVISEHEPKPGLFEPSQTAPEATSLPSVDQLLGKYVQALGGAEALQKISSRVEKGTITFGARQFPIEILAKAPDKRVSEMYLPNGVSVTGYDGRSGWVASPGRPLHEMTGSELEAASFDAIFSPATRLKQLFSDLSVERAEQLGGRKAYVLQGLKPGQPPVQLYFDEQSGFLVRLVRYDESPLGRLPTQIDYSDYRSTDGVKTPFRWTVARPRGRFVVQVEQMQQNVPIDESKFTRPQ